MELKGPPITPEQKLYGTWLLWGTRATLTLLIAAFALYVLGLVPAHVPIEQLPQLWELPADELLRRTGVQPGWGWASLVARADMLNMAGIALVASVSIPCVAAVLPIFVKRGEPVLAWICVLQVAVLVLAASGVLAGAH